MMELKKSVKERANSPKIIGVFGIMAFCVILLIVFFFAMETGLAATFNCSIVSTGSCNSPNITLFYMKNDSSGYENAHAQNTTHSPYSDYNYALCCSSDVALSNSCNDVTVLRLFNLTNSHVQIGNYSNATYGVGFNYTVNACISSAAGTLGCYYPVGSCGASYSCIGSIASSNTAMNNLTDSHYGSCNHYTRNICCGLGNSAPTVTLIYPANGAFITNRTPMFNWTGSDLDGDTLQYELNITCYNSTGGYCLTKGNDNRYYNTTILGTRTNYTLPSELMYLNDYNYYYNWSVRAYDGIDYGVWATPFVLKLNSYVAISMNVSLVEFGTMGLFGSNDTTDDSPRPFVIQNDGNCIVNVTTNASNLWQSVSNPNSYYRFKVDNNTQYNPNENLSFNWAQSLTTFTNVPNTTGQLLILEGFNYSDSRDSAEIDVAVQLPPGEQAGVKTSVITFYATMDE